MVFPSVFRAGSGAGARSLGPLLLRRGYRVLAFGQGNSGALGQGDLEDQYEPTLVATLPDNVTSIACGHFHSVAVTECGQVWTWGRNDERQLGHRGQSDFNPRVCDVPRRVRVPREVRDPVEALPERATLAMAEEEGQEGEVAASLEHIEKRHSDEGGNPGASDDEDGEELQEQAIVRKAYASGVATFAIDDRGAVYSWGASKRGQLGLGHGVVESETPRAIAFPNDLPIKHLSAGWGHAVAIADTDNGELFSWGYPVHGRLGYGYSEIQQQKAKAFDEMKKSGARRRSRSSRRSCLSWRVTRPKPPACGTRRKSLAFPASK